MPETIRYVPPEEDKNKFKINIKGSVIKDSILPKGDRNIIDSEIIGEGNHEKANKEDGGDWHKDIEEANAGLDILKKMRAIKKGEKIDINPNDETEAALGVYQRLQEMKKEKQGQKKCAKCGIVSENSAKFCSNCGLRLEEIKVQEIKADKVKICLKCGAEAHGMASFCGECGSNL